MLDQAQVQTLAIIMVGAFLMVLATAIFYVFAFRPRLKESSSMAMSERIDEELREDLKEQRTALERLNAALARHTLQLENAVLPDEALTGVHSMLALHADAVKSLTGLVQDQASKIAGIDDRLIHQDVRFERIEHQLAAQIADLPRVDYDYLTGVIQTQSDQLAAISRRLEEGAVSQPQTSAAHSRRPDSTLDSTLSEHARILAELDRELAAQATLIQGVGEKVSNHAGLLAAAAEERRHQTTLVERVLDQVAQIVPAVNKLIVTPRAGQDRLTDIKGIGPVYAARLYEAGIQTFRQLAVMTPEEIHVLMDEPIWRKKSIHPASWIEQARHLASQREKVERIV